MDNQFQVFLVSDEARPLPLTEHFLPKFSAEETLFSWCARFHRLTCNVDPRTTSRQLFGHPHAGLRHDLPRNLEYFSRVTQGKLGTAEQLLYQRTHFGLFAPFLSPQKQQALVKGVLTDKHGVVRQGLGLAKQGNDLTTDLKMCDLCMEEDCLVVPTGWWRLAHQWLPVRVCLEHQRPLRSLAAEMTRYGLRAWVLPGDVSRTSSAEIAVSKSQTQLLTRIAHWTNFLIQRPELNLQGDLLRHVYMLKSLQHGWIAFDGTLRFSDLCRAFLKMNSTLIDLPGLGFLKDANKINGGFLGLLLRQYGGLRHPIKHIYLMAFLFDNEEEFLAMYQTASGLAAREGKATLPQRLTRQREHLKNLLINCGKSVNSASNEVGVTATTAIRFLKRSNIPYELRPRVLTSDLKQHLEEMIFRGDQRDDIAKKLSIRKSYIKNYLTQNKGLRDAWIVANRQRISMQYRAHFLRVLSDNPGVPIKRIRQIPKNGFEWLYRNDREWLEVNLPGIWRRTNGSEK